MDDNTTNQQPPLDPFEELKTAEELLKLFVPTGNENEDYLQLISLLEQERVVDYCRPIALREQQANPEKANDYLLREYTFRHNISTFALQLSQTVTDRITGEPPAEKSRVAAYIKSRQVYPAPQPRV